MFGVCGPFLVRKFAPPFTATVAVAWRTEP